MADERISFFPVPQPQDLPENLQKLFAKAQETIGFVPNVFRVMSYRPERLSAWFTHFRSLHEPTENLGVAAMYNFTNRMALATGMLPNREYHALSR